MTAASTRGAAAGLAAVRAGESVSGLRVWTASLPLGLRLRHATADVDALTAVIVEVRLADGTTGLAEVRTNGAYATGEDEATVLAALRGLEPMNRTSAELAADVADRSNLAAMAVDVALWDAVARRSGVALYEAWNPIAPPTDSVRTHAQIGFGDVAAGRRLAASFVSQGFDRLKVRVGAPDPSVDIARLRAIRETVGPDVRIIVDANGGWSFDTAAAVLDPLAEIGVDWLEQPVQSISDLARLRRHSGVPIYADESVRDAESVERLIAVDAVDGVHLKLEKSGTVARLFHTVARAKVNGIAVTLGQMDQGRLGCAVTAHLAIALGLSRAELWGWANITRDLTDALVMRDGCVVLPTAHGHGITEFDTSLAREIL